MKLLFAISRYTVVVSTLSAALLLAVVATTQAGASTLGENADSRSTSSGDAGGAPSNEEVPPDDAGGAPLWDEAPDGGKGDQSIRRSHGSSNPPPCTATLHDIHESHHRPGRMNVGFTARCRQEISELHIWAQLWEDRIWGWDRIGIKGKLTRSNVRFATVHANDRCRNNSIKATASGHGKLNGVKYRGFGRTTYADNPCDL